MHPAPPSSKTLAHHLHFTADDIAFTSTNPAYPSAAFNFRHCPPPVRLLHGGRRCDDPSFKTRCGFAGSPNFQRHDVRMLRIYVPRHRRIYLSQSILPLRSMVPPGTEIVRQTGIPGLTQSTQRFKRKVRRGTLCELCVLNSANSALKVFCWLRQETPQPQSHYGLAS